MNFHLRDAKRCTFLTSRWKKLPTPREKQHYLLLHPTERILFKLCFSRACFTMSRGYWSRMPGHFKLWLPSWTDWHTWVENMSLVRCTLSWIFFGHSKRSFVSPRGHVISSLNLIWKLTSKNVSKNMSWQKRQPQQTENKQYLYSLCVCRHRLWQPLLTGTKLTWKAFQTKKKTISWLFFPQWPKKERKKKAQDDI